MVRFQARSVSALSLQREPTQGLPAALETTGWQERRTASFRPETRQEFQSERRRSPSQYRDRRASPHGAGLVFEKLGVGLLRRSWFTLDLIWVGALMLTGALTLLV